MSKGISKVKLIYPVITNAYYALDDLYISHLRSKKFLNSYTPLYNAQMYRQSPLIGKAKLQSPTHQGLMFDTRECGKNISNNGVSEKHLCPNTR